MCKKAWRIGIGMDEASALALVRNNIGRHRKSVEPLQLAKTIRYLYELYNHSCGAVASRTSCDENTVQLWVRLSEAFAAEKKIANHVQAGLIHPVSMYRIISYFGDLQDSVGFADSVAGLTDEAIRLILKCLKRGGTIQECKKQVGMGIAGKLIRRSDILLSGGDYISLKALADKRGASVPATAKWLLERWVMKNLPRIWTIVGGEAGYVKRQGNKWLVGLMLPRTLDSTVRSCARIVGRTPSDILEEMLRTESR
jgi:hypothetical protein